MTNDEPLIHLLSIKHNPLVVNMTPDQLTALVQKLRHQNHAELPPPKKTPKSESKSDKRIREFLQKYGAIRDNI